MDIEIAKIIEKLGLQKWPRALPNDSILEIKVSK